MKNFTKLSKKQWLGIVLLGFTILLFSGVRAAYHLGRDQGATSVRWTRFTLANVIFDEDGIPTIQASDWHKAVEAQGYVVASERLWQMDLMRRFMAGRLSEWYGDNPRTIALDSRRKAEDWDAVATAVTEGLPPEDREACEDYARGVNRFIAENRYYWGIEYLVLRLAPEPWTCRDSMMVYLSLSEDLSGKSDWETYGGLWRKALGPDWSRFLFPQSHPWSEPLFGKKDAFPFPPKSRYLPMAPLTDEEKAAVSETPADATGSNAWAWRGKTGLFLANDPHLGTTVPMIWYLNRLRLNENEWAVGASIPGVPGLVLGMNAHYGWGFTNSMEDVDDYLKEEISADGKSYVDRIEKGNKVFLPIEVRELKVNVRGGNPRTVLARFTRRGPLSRPEHLTDGEYSRQWLVFQKGIFRLPMMAVAQAKDWKEFNAAFDAMASPAVSVFYADRKGNMGYRLSGRGVKRKADGLMPQDALTGEWDGLEKAESRHRAYYPAAPETAAPEQIVSANQRMWTGPYGHYFCGENRARRIRQFLKDNPHQTRETMERLQRDTVSYYHLELARFVSQHASPKNVVQIRLLEGLRLWDGSAEGNPLVFTQAVRLDKLVQGVLLARARKAFLPPESWNLRYRWNLSSAWILETLTREKGLAVFGLTEKEFAEFLLASLEPLSDPPKDRLYPQQNRWQAQHPFVGNVPILGRLFKVEETPQVGFSDLVRTETNHSGSSIRIVWDLRNPINSTWIMPVGQSGHVGSPHFQDLQKKWFSQKTVKVFSAAQVWGLISP